MDAFARFREIFGREKVTIGMLHLPALPGTPRYGGDTQTIIDTALREAEVYTKAGMHALMIENMHDVPYLNRRVGPEITAMMSVVAQKLKDNFDVPLGIQILAGANKDALAAALAADADFIRAEGFVFGHVADEGMMQSDAGELLRYRKYISAEHIAVFTDIKKKHGSHQLTADTDITDHAKAAAFFLSDGLVITGSETGRPASVEELKAVKKAVELPVLIGSGLTADNLEKYYPYADGFIVGSYFKRGGRWDRPVDAERVKAWMDKWKALEQKG